MGERDWMDSTTLYDELKPTDSGSKFPYKNAGALSRALRNLKDDITPWVEVIGPEKRSGGNNKTFWHIEPGPRLVLTPKDKQKGQ